MGVRTVTDRLRDDDDDYLRDAIGDDDDYDRFIDIEYRASRELEAGRPIQLRVMSLYEVSFLLRLFRRVNG